MKHTPLYDLHVARGAKIVDFAGWALPVSYPDGLIAEHTACREGAALFDVSHMGQVRLDVAPEALETLVPGGIASLKVGGVRYTQFTTPEGGIIDDLMVTRDEGSLFLVVNASRRDVDLALLREAFGDKVEEIEAALIAVQGPTARAEVGALCPEAADMAFMTSRMAVLAGVPVRISCLGYTGEDGFEISVPSDRATEVAEALLARGVAPAGLGARDSLRLEAGLCLYGNDIDETTSPIEAGLGWSVPKRRREAGDFPGAARIVAEAANGPARKLVGLRPEGRAPARAGTEILDTDGTALGTVTSGGFSPTLGAPISMGYVPSSAAAPGTPVTLSIRGKSHPATIVALPFVPHRYKR